MRKYSYLCYDIIWHKERNTCLFLGAGSSVAISTLYDTSLIEQRHIYECDYRLRSVTASPI